jgi:hypothetical protein
MAADVLHWFLNDGIGQGLVDTLIVSIPAVIWARIKVLPEWREHRRRVREIHEALITRSPKREGD